MNKNIEPIRILIVEDNPTDARLLSEILNELELKLVITVARDGQQALDMLTEGGVGPSNPAPDLVILDLNLPKVHGYEVLAFIRSGSLRSIPVAVMTGSLNREDEVKARRMGATHYLLKPASSDEFDDLCSYLKNELTPLIGGGKGRDRTGLTNVGSMSCQEIYPRVAPSENGPPKLCSATAYLGMDPSSFRTPGGNA